MLKPDIVSFGDLIADILLPIPSLPIFPDQIQLAHGISMEPGGMGNFLIMASRLGARVVPVGRIGDDLYGQMIQQKLSQEGVDMSAVEVAAGRQSTIAFVFVSDIGEHVFLGVLGSARMDVQANIRAGEMIASARAFYSNGYAFLDADPPELVIEAMQTARRSAVPIYFDPGPQVEHVERSLILRAIAETDTLFMTLDEAAILTGRADPQTASANLLGLGPSQVVIKMGVEGCLMAGPGWNLVEKAFPVEVRDTSGAGDAFDAAFITGVQRGLSIRQTGCFANAAGALTVTKMGAGTRLPTKKEVLELLDDASISNRLERESA